MSRADELVRVTADAAGIYIRTDGPLTVCLNASSRYWRACHEQG